MPPLDVFSPPRIDIWAGPECSYVKIRGRIRDQFDLTGHWYRPDDLDAVAALGIRTIRYPLLWERIETSPDHYDWQWFDERFAQLRALGITPIVGFVHHGSGPDYANLLDPAFPALLARYAVRVMERYPWLEHFNPVNEPLTTARFSGLYGLWEPHRTNDAGFISMLLNECRAIILTMQALRRINPKARLIQTEDVGKTWSTPQLAYQAAFENHRRWLSFDLLFGRVGKDHPLRDYMLASGVREHDLSWFEENACPPDIIGVNYYITSERFLDHRLDGYADRNIGGNGRHRYADIEAVRILKDDPAGLGNILLEAWERYRTPIAVTEVQLADEENERLRWLMGTWRIVNELRERAHIIAIAPWSIFGAYDWDSLLTQPAGHYESGLWVVQEGRLQPTILAAAVRELAGGHDFDHPALQQPGWWQRPSRLLYPAFEGGETTDKANLCAA